METFIMIVDGILHDAKCAKLDLSNEKIKKLLCRSVSVGLNYAIEQNKQMEL